MTVDGWLVTGDIATRVVGEPVMVRRGKFATIQAAIAAWEEQEAKRQQHRLEELGALVNNAITRMKTPAPPRVPYRREPPLDTGDLP
jgi:hypothetical protein